MTINDKINQMSTEEKAKLFSSWTTTGACNDFGTVYLKENPTENYKMK